MSTTYQPITQGDPRLLSGYTPEQANKDLLQLSKTIARAKKDLRLDMVGSQRPTG